MDDFFSGRENSRKRQSTLMPRDEEGSLGSGFRSNDETDRYFSEAHSNPARLGCLTTNEIRALARKERDISDPGF